MRFARRQLVFIAAVACVSAAAILLLRFDGFDPAKDGQRIDLALLQDMLSGGKPTSRYRLITDSVMTGLCWRSGDGAREGVFRDVNAGMAHWRDRAPGSAGRQTPAGAHPVAGGNDSVVDYALLSQQLDRLSYQATAYTLSEHSVQLTGELAIGDRRREVTMNMTLPGIQPGRSEQRKMIELRASTELAADDLDSVPLAPDARPLNLCITMQAVKESVLPDSSADRPLMLSHYYQ